VSGTQPVLLLSRQKIRLNPFRESSRLR